MHIVGPVGLVVSVSAKVVVLDRPTIDVDRPRLAGMSVRVRSGAATSTAGAGRDDAATLFQSRPVLEIELGELGPVEQHDLALGVADKSDDAELVQS